LTAVVGVSKEISLGYILGPLRLVERHRAWDSSGLSASRHLVGHECPTHTGKSSAAREPTICGILLVRIACMTSAALDFSRFRVITFDCYGTLIDWEAGILGAIRPILAAHGAGLSDAEILGLYGELEAEAEGSDYKPYREVLREVVRGFGLRLGFHASDEQQQSLPESLADWKPFPDTVSALRRLKSGFKLGIISNVDDDLFAASARRLEVEFDFVTTAGEAWAYKPSTEIFRRAQEKMETSPQHWLHAGQSIYHDVIPARGLGISTIWVNRRSRRPGVGAVKPASGEPDVTVKSLAELAQLAVS
jgi:2-haloacid dehalogenase